MKIQALHPNFVLPTRAHKDSAGFDLYMPEGGMLGTGEVMKVGLGFASEIPDYCVALLLPRSGSGSQGLELVNTAGVIDCDYRGEWIATLRMGKPGIFAWKAGDRILQAVLLHRYIGGIEKVDSVEKTERGFGGFGSTGL